MTFIGSKMALFLGDQLAVIERDDIPEIPYPGYFDWPGGGREGDETPLACAIRECFEELGLQVPEAAVWWSRAFDGLDGVGWFFVAKLPAYEAQNVRFGDEGQRWLLMTVDEFQRHPKAVPHFQDRLKVWIDEGCPDERPPASLAGGR